MQQLSAPVLLFLMVSGSAHAATISAYGNVSVTGYDTLGGPAGGNDYKEISTNTAGGDAHGSVDAFVSSVAGYGSASASADIATGQLKAKVGGNVGTYYSPSTGAGIFSQELVSSASALVSETFSVMGSGIVRFELAYNGFWNIVAQPYISCCDFDANPSTGIVTGIFDPAWFAFGSLVLGGDGGPISDTFEFRNDVDPLTGSASGILSVSALLVEGHDYGISSTIDMFMSYSSGAIDFSHTATLSYFLDPGMSIIFDDARFLTVDPDAPSPIPLPASFVLLASALLGFGVNHKRFGQK